MKEIENLITLTLVYEYSCMELLYKFTCRNTSNLIVLDVDEDKYIPLCTNCILSNINLISDLFPLPEHLIW